MLCATHVSRFIIKKDKQFTSAARALQPSPAWGQKSGESNLRCSIARQTEFITSHSLNKWEKKSLLD